MSLTIGESLSKARKERHITLEQAGKDTHIRIHYLEALEKNQFDLIPSKPQAKGFLRLYADYLLVQPEPLISAWESDTFIIPENEVIEIQPDLEEIIISEPKPENLVPDVVEEKPVMEQELPTHDEMVTTPESDGTDFEMAQQSSETKEIKGEEILESKMVQAEIGSLLKKQREALGLSLEDIERYTHIRKHHLKDIEIGHIQDLPSTVQARGMIQNYSKFLDLDSDLILQRFADSLQLGLAERIGNEQTGKSSKDNKTKNKLTLPLRRLVTPDLMIGSFIIFFIVILAIWGTSQVIQNRNEEMVSTAPGISEFLLVTPTKPLSEFSEVDMATQTPTIQAAIEDDFPPLDDDIVPTGTLPVDDAPLQVYLVSHQRTYLKVIIDGEEVFNGRVKPGNAYPYDGEEFIEILAGDASAIQVFFNQNDLGTLGSTGQVLDLIFTNSGIITPTPMFTSTSTETPQPTITIQVTETPEATPTATETNSETE